MSEKRIPTSFPQYKDRDYLKPLLLWQRAGRKIFTVAVDKRLCWETIDLSSVAASPFDTGTRPVAWQRIDFVRSGLTWRQHHDAKHRPRPGREKRIWNIECGWQSFSLGTLKLTAQSKRWLYTWWQEELCGTAILFLLKFSGQSVWQCNLFHSFSLMICCEDLFKTK